MPSISCSIETGDVQCLSIYIYCIYLLTSNGFHFNLSLLINYGHNGWMDIMVTEEAVFLAPLSCSLQHHWPRCGQGRCVVETAGGNNNNTVPLTALRD